MKASARVLKNSAWLVAQPLVLNVLSLFATAYIARTLGQVSYGKFIFAFSFVSLFLPIVNLGLRTITVRQIAADRPGAPGYARKMLGIRFILALFALAVIAAAVNILGYDRQTRLIVYIASFNILLQALASTLVDVFQGFERMAPVATSQFAGGFVLTILSVVVLYLGFRLTGLTLTYVFGTVVTLSTIWWHARRLIGWPRLQFDWTFAKSKVVQGFPFFYPSLFAIVGYKAAVILLSFFGGDAAVGRFGAASTLAERVTYISDGVCTAIYPTLVVLRQKSPREAAELFRRFFEYLMMIGLPIAVGTTVMADPIILLIYGDKFAAAAPVLRLLVWWACVNFLTMLSLSGLWAAGLEKKAAVVIVVTSSFYVLLNLALIPVLGEQGAGWANLGAEVVSLLLLAYFVGRHVADPVVRWPRVARIVAANVCMGLCVMLVRGFNIALPLAVGVVSYAAASFALGVVSIEELKELRRVVLDRGKRAAVSVEPHPEDPPGT